MNDEDMKLVVDAALERAFAKQVAKPFGVYMASQDEQVGLQRFMEGFKKACAALESIETELATSAEC